MSPRFKDSDYPIPDWQIVPKCICVSGNPNSACPYAQPEEGELIDYFKSVVKLEDAN